MDGDVASDEARVWAGPVKADDAPGRAGLIEFLSFRDPLARISFRCGFADLPVTFTTAQARRVGIQYRDLYQARDDDVVRELSRGVFRRSEAPAPTYPDLLAVAMRARRAVVCLLSAAAVHHLSDELPTAAQIAVPRGTWPPKIDHPPVQVFVWSPALFETGLSFVDAAPGERVRVYSPARTVVDLLRMRHKLGESVAHIALRRYLARGDARSGS